MTAEEEIEKQAEAVANHIGVTPFSDMRVHVVHAAAVAIGDEREFAAQFTEMYGLHAATETERRFCEEIAAQIRAGLHIPEEA
jgi:hypothetical protein